MAAPSSSRHILAINDSEDVLQLYRDLFEEEGYRVSTQAYVSTDLGAICELRPDLIILDYMSEAEDAGWALLQMLRMSPDTEAIPIVLCTGAIRQVAPLTGHLAEMGVRVILKPFNIEDLLLEIARALGDVSPPEA